jgi:PAS domain S-box-containing protein
MDNCKILIVEDEMIIGSYIKDLLQKVDYKVVDIVVSGEDAIKKSKELIPDLILMDIILAGKIDGIEAARIIHKSLSIPIVYLTGNADFNTVIRARETQPFGYILKPVNIQDLYSTIDTAIRRHELEIKYKEKSEELESLNEELRVTNEELLETQDQLKKTHEKALETEKKYHILFEEMINGFALHEIICDKSGNPVNYRFIDINPAFEKLTGLTRDIVGKTVLDVMPETEKYWIENYGKVALTGDSIEFENYAKELDAYYKVTAFSPEKGKFAVIFEDITRIKKEEAKNLESERRFREMLENIHLLAVMLDINGNITFCNDFLLSVSGWNRKEIIGRNWFNIFQRKNFEAETVFNRLINDDKSLSIHYENEILTKDGKIRLISWTNTILKDVNGKIIGTTSIGEDITDRKKSEGQLKASLQEKEILLREIHHRVKNNLQIIISLLGLQAQRITDKDLADKFNDSINRIRSMSIVHENLYQNNDFSKIDLSIYLRKMSMELMKSYNCEDKIEININSGDVYLNIEQAVPCGLMMNEILTNAVKYAFPDEWSGIPVINITIKENGKYIEIITEDNGIGLKNKVNLGEPATMGMSLINLLVFQLSGEIDIELEKGTKYIVRFEKER